MTRKKRWQTERQIDGWRASGRTTTNVDTSISLNHFFPFFFLYKSLTFILRLLSQFVSLFQLFVILFPHISFVFPFVGRVLYSVGVFSFHFLLRVPIILFSLYSFIFRDSIFDIKVRHGWQFEMNKQAAELDLNLISYGFISLLLSLPLFRLPGKNSKHKYTNRITAYISFFFLFIII